MRIVCVSDIHTRPVSTPDADVLIVSGDLTCHGSETELAWFKQWLRAQPARYKVFIAGNHDKKLQTHPYTTRDYLKDFLADGNIFYLEETAVTIEGLVFWGSPWTPSHGEGAFALRSQSAAREHWLKIPDHVDVLVTHGPPHGIMDELKCGKHVGDDELLAAVKRVKPRLHAFGHIHTAHGKTEIDETTYVNAAVCNDHDWNYQVVNDPIVVDLELAPQLQ